AQFFAFGWFLHRQANLRFAFVRYRWAQLGLALAVFVALETHGLPAAALVYARALYPWLVVSGLLGLFVHHFAHPSPQARYLADASYWTYLAHWPVLSFLQISLARVLIPGPLKVALIVSAVMAFCLIS